MRGRDRFVSVLVSASLFATGAMVPLTSVAIAEGIGEAEAAAVAQDVSAGIASISLAQNGNTVTPEVVAGSYVYDVSSATNVTDYQVTVGLAGGATLTPSTPQGTELYVESATDSQATLKFNMIVDEVNLNTDQFALALTSNDGGVTWTGGFNAATGVTLDVLASYLEGQDVRLAAGSLGQGSEAQSILVNKDESSVVFAICDPAATICTVTYQVGSDTYAWKLPQGATVPVPTFSPTGGGTLDGWFTDQEFFTALAQGATVTGDMALYGKIASSTGESGVLAQIEAGGTVTIGSLEDWDTFVANSDKVKDDQLVKLTNNINCQNARYDSMEFAGNFDGDNHVISNASFLAVDSGYYNSTESDIVCSGVFASLGPGQIVTNITLANISAEFSTTYAGVLAGIADGTASNPVHIQNVQVRGGSASGRTAAGVVGFTRNATVLYCSSTGTTITGLANGGGIVGINNSKVECCYSTTTPTALPSFLGGSTGGVVSKKVRGGYAEYCWSTMTVVGSSDAGGADTGLLVADADTPSEAFTANGFTQECWNLDSEPYPSFVQDEVEYAFPVSS